MDRPLAVAADLQACLALRDAEAAANARARQVARSNPELVAHLEADAKRRGLREVDWSDYYRNARINYP